jgi:thymidylate synthase ThyX
MTPAERLAPHVTNLDKPVYALHGLPPEVVAVLFAQVSRSSAGFRENLLKLMDEDGLPEGGGAGFDVERASAFHEKWVLGYGHASVAEHAVLHFAVEELSILAAKALEDARLAAFTEKSSRYQVFDVGRFHWPAEWRGDPDEAEARALVGELFAAYAQCYKEQLARLEAGRARPEGLSERAWRQTLHATACDTARYLLPAGALTSLGMTVNARTAAHLIRKLRAHDLAELRALGDRLEEEGRCVTPVLLKHAKPGPWQAGWRHRSRTALPAWEPMPGEDPPRVRLLEVDRDGSARVLADWLVRERGLGVEEARRRAEELGVEARAAILDALLAGLGDHDAPPRAFEQVRLTVEFCLDYGAWRDLQRHRLLTPTTPDLGCRWGWELPPELDGAARGRTEELLERTARLWRRLAERNPAAAAYLVPMAFRLRFAQTLNLREAEHLVRLRSAPAGHPSYRAAAQDLHGQLVQALPELAPFLRVHGEPALWAREEEIRREERKRKVLGVPGDA